MYASLTINIILLASCIEFYKFFLYPLLGPLGLMLKTFHITTNSFFKNNKVRNDLIVSRNGSHLSSSPSVIMQPGGVIWPIANLLENGFLFTETEFFLWVSRSCTNAWLEGWKAKDRHVLNNTLHSEFVYICSSKLGRWLLFQVHKCYTALIIYIHIYLYIYLYIYIYLYTWMTQCYQGLPCTIRAKSMMRRSFISTNAVLSCPKIKSNCETIQPPLLELHVMERQICDFTWL